LINAYVLVQDNTTKDDVAKLLMKIPNDELSDYRFIKGHFIQPTISYDLETTNEEIETTNKKNVTQRIFDKWSQGSVFGEQENNQGSI